MGESRASSGRFGLLVALGAALLVVVAFLLRGGGARGGDGADTGAAREGRSETELVPAEALEREPLTAAGALESEKAAGTTAATTARSGERADARLQVTGRVVDEQGSPIEGAEVHGRVTRDEKRVFARTDESGAFRGEVARSHYLAFEILAPAFARGEVGLVAEARDVLDLGTIVLLPGGSVSGRVVEEGGRAPAAGRVALVAAETLPVEGGRAELSEADELGDDLNTLLDGELAPDGAFELRGVPLGEHVLVADTPGGMAWTSPFRLEAGATVERDLVVPRADESHWIAGRVRSAQGEPLEGVGLGLEDSEGWIDMAQSAPDGRFFFQLTEPGVFRLSASDPRQRGADLELAGVQSGQRALELVLEPVPLVEVRLRDAHGAAIAWGNVWSNGGDSEVPLTPLGERGIGRIPFVGKDLRLEAQAPGYERTEFGPYGREILRTGLELVLSSGGFVRGRVTSGGRAVPGARLALSWARGGDTASLSRGITPDGWPFEVTDHVELVGEDGTSDADGRFLLSVPSSGMKSLRVEAEGFPLTVFGPWDLDPGRTNPELVVELAPGGTLEGRILLPAGETPSGRVVGLSNGWSFAHTTAVDGEGRFRFVNLAPGAYQVRPLQPPVASLHVLEVDWGATQLERKPDVEVRAGATARFDLDLVTPRGWALGGHFHFEGVDVAGWSVALTTPRSSQATARAFVGPDGAFRVVVPQPGPYRLSLSKERRSFFREVHLSERDSTLELSFARATASVAVPEGVKSGVRLEGTCVDGSTFRAWSWGNGTPQTWRVEVPPGSFRLEGGNSSSEPFELAPGEERALSLPAPSER